MVFNTGQSFVGCGRVGGGYFTLCGTAKKVNIVEVVSTATELTYVIEKKDLAAALEQLQKDI